MNICVVGSGYVGLVTGACLADFGMHVVGVDKDARQGRGALAAARSRSTSPASTPWSQKNMEEGRLRFSTDLGPAIEEAQAIFIAVGTPPKPDGSADLTFIREVAASIAEHLNGYKIIITKSTVPIGTGRMIETHRPRRGRAASTRFAVVSQPRVPARGLGDRRLHAPRPRRHRHPRPAGDRADEGDLLAARTPPTCRSSSPTSRRPS